MAMAGGDEVYQLNGATQLLDGAFENLYSDNYIQTMELIVDAPGSRATSKQLQVIRRQRSQPGKALIRFLNPYDIRRTAVLVLQNEGGLDDLYVYFPALRMIRRISSAQRADSFFGTDLSFEDIEPKVADDYIATEVSNEVRGGDCTGMEIVSRENVRSTYDRMVLCVEGARNLIHAIDYYRSGELIKQLDVDVSSVRVIGDRNIPFMMTMRTLRRRSETRIVTKRYELLEGIPESVFSMRNLESGDAAGDRGRVVDDE
jgi:hypothetical protein